MDKLRQENEQLKRENADLRSRLAEAEAKIKQLTELLGQNNRDSNWPSSRDKSCRRKLGSQRKRSQRLIDGQKGHQGHTFLLNPEPDIVEVHRLEQCAWCAHIFEDDVTVKQLAVYLRTEQVVPYQRSRQLLHDLFALPVSIGSLQNFMVHATEKVNEATDAIKLAVTEADIVHADETDFYIGGQRYWLHTVSTPQLSYLMPHHRLREQVFDAIGVLPQLAGTLVHDAWTICFKYEVATHTLCNAQTKICNLVERFAQNKDAILRFAHDFKVPFDNNLAEWDIRMMNVQQKLPDCFRGEADALQFCKLRTYTSTIRKQGANIWNAVGLLFHGYVLNCLGLHLYSCQGYMNKVLVLSICYQYKIRTNNLSIDAVLLSNSLLS